MRIWVRPVPGWSGWSSVFPAARGIGGGGGWGWGGFSDREKPLLTSNAAILKEQVLLEGGTCPFGGSRWEGCAGSWGLRRGAGVQGRGWADPRSPGGGGKWGRAGLGFEGPSPRRAAGLVLGRDCELSPPPPSRLAPAAAIREVRGGFLLSALRGRRSEATAPPLPRPLRHSGLPGAPRTHLGPSEASEAASAGTR